LVENIDRLGTDLYTALSVELNDIMMSPSKLLNVNKDVWDSTVSKFYETINETPFPPDVESKVIYTLIKELLEVFNETHTYIFNRADKNIGEDDQKNIFNPKGLSFDNIAPE
jgi:hypothetical protein